MQISLNIVYKILIFIGLSISLLQPGQHATAQVLTRDAADGALTSHFLKPEIFQKSGALSFNIVRVINQADTAIRIKPIIVLPSDWTLFSMAYNDTLVLPKDSISLIYRFKLPDRMSTEVDHQVFFRAYSMNNKLLSESSSTVYPEAVHYWDVIVPDQRVFFHPRMNKVAYEIRLENNGNIAEVIDLDISTDKKVELTSLGDWQFGQGIRLEPYQDTVLKFNLKYVNPIDRVFDLSKIQINAVSGDEKLIRAMMVEKYDDTYAPFIVDRALPHQVEVGFRTFSGNEKFLPFIKARGISTLKNKSTFFYNFNYYALTGNENFIRNSYYTFLYTWQSFKVGFGAFSSNLGRNLYTRHGFMVSNVVKLSPGLSLEAFVSQSIFTPKTSVAVGYTLSRKKIGFNGSFAYDIDGESQVKTGSAMLQSKLIPLVKNHDMSVNLYGYHEYHYLNNDFTYKGFAWDINYIGTFGETFKVLLSNNYGSPDIPGPQMGLLSFSAQYILLLGDKKKYLSARYINSSRDYYAYNFEGFRIPNTYLYDQYANFTFHSNNNPNHTWEAGPSVEAYLSYRPLPTVPGERTEYNAKKIRFEYKGGIAKRLTLNMKTGLSDISIIDSREIHEQRYDFHLLGGYNLSKGLSLSFSYDYGPMVNSGLYQFAGDAKNHSINFGPSYMKSFFKERVNFSLFANLTYRFDLEYGSANVNPKIEAFLYRDWYAVMTGTYHFTRQNYPEIQVQKSYIYFEFSLKKRWGKSDLNKWQKNTRQLKVILFKDDNSNGVKDEFEQGIPFVKTRLILTNSDNPNISTEFPVDITLLSSEKGIVYYNRLPTGFYDLAITPLGDVKEYFYVDRSIDKLQLTRNMTYYVPFQKATKITGQLFVERQKFIKKGEENIDLKNIKITAYNKQGNSYSSFTLEDGSFTIFVPGFNTYYLRMGNVFGSNYKILKNDISITVADTTNNYVEFNVAEVNRQVKFKSAKTATPDTLEPAPLKIKILHGKFYENSGQVPVDKDAMPEFKIKEAPVIEQEMIPGNHYVVIGTDISRTGAVKLIRIVEENGISANLGYDETSGRYYIFTKYYQNKGDSRDELQRLRNAGLQDAEVIKF